MQPRPALLLIALAALLAPRPRAAPPPLDYAKDVRPLLEQHCFNCHGPDKQKAGLRLDRKASALKGGDSGEPAVVPGNPIKSHLVKVLTTDDPDQIMPPKGERLKPADVALLQRWIETGAHWTEAPGSANAPEVLETSTDREITAADRQFWSFVPPRAAEPPAVRHDLWPRNDVDRHVLARMESRGLAPAPEADPAALIRRVTYDLTGLPPTPDEVQSFLADRSDGAFERVVDRLLASPRFGERMASFWLPLARYGEDQAHQVGKDTKFFYPHAWKYRQWVIDAFNRDLPYDRFVAYQLAADRIPGATPADQAALGFVGLGPKYYNRGSLEVQADEWEDRIDTVCRTTLALTVACARCHDHKFDPISTRDYYALAGVFANTKLVNKSADGQPLKEVPADQIDPAVVHVVEDVPAPQNLNLFIRGNVTRKGPVVPRHFLSVLSPGAPQPFKDGSGRRELADCIASRDNPLTARVMVNRLWGLVFGTPLVVTPSNFGHSGMPPTNPALLDALALRFMDAGWSTKALLRDLVCSSTYRQSAAASPDKLAADPANECLAHASRRRLTVEQWRDGLLFIAGQLQSDDVRSAELDDASNFRRTVYARISRLKLNDLLMQFDYPDPNVHAEKRSVTNTPIQKLLELNGPFAIARAKALAARVAADVKDGDDAAKITRAYWLAFARAPLPDELDAGVDFLKGPPASPALSRWDEYAQVLLVCNEAFYVD